MKVSLAPLTIFIAVAVSSYGQAVAAPRFEVATIKAVEDLNPRMAQALDTMRSTMPQRGGLPLRGRRVEMKNYTLAHLIAAAFRIPPRQISGPGWLSDKRFNVEAIIPSDAPIEQANEMLQTLLRERFGLSTSSSTREQSGYILSVGKSGPNFPVSAPLPSGDAAKAEPPSPDSLMRRFTGPGTAGSSRYEYKHMSMNQLSETLAGLLEVPVEDRTGLKVSVS